MKIPGQGDNHIQLIQLKKLRYPQICLLLLILLGCNFAGHKCEAKKLKGRIETIFIDGKIKVPEELFAHAEEFDERLIENKKKPRIIDARLKTFPAKLRGEWSGVLRLVKFQINDSTDDKIGPNERKLLKKGRKLRVKFRFHTPGDGRVTMAPPYGKFEKSQDLKTDTYMPLIDPSTGQQLPPPKGGRWRSIDFNNDIDHKLLLNRVTMLSTERVEQDLLVAAFLKNRKTGKERVHLEEHIYDFERIGTFHLKVKLAEVRYDSKGNWKLTVLYEGDVH